MNAKYLTVVAALAIMLVAATALATTADNAFADKKRHDDKKKGGHGDSQAVADAIDCGNGDSPVDVFCQNLGSLTQGDGNAGISIGKQS